MKLVPTDAVFMTNDAWLGSFGRVETNKKATSERGWHPHNRMNLQHPETRATMTSEEREAEKIKPLCYKNKCSEEESMLALNLPTINSTYLKEIAASIIKFNFQNRFSSVYLDKIVQHGELREARERIRKRQEEVSTIKDRLKKITKFNACNHVKAGANLLGKTTLDLMTNMRKEKERTRQEKLGTKRQELANVFNDASEFLTMQKP